MDRKHYLRGREENTTAAANKVDIATGTLENRRDPGDRYCNNCKHDEFVSTSAHVRHEKTVNVYKNIKRTPNIIYCMYAYNTTCVPTILRRPNRDWHVKMFN